MDGTEQVFADLQNPVTAGRASIALRSSLKLYRDCQALLGYRTFWGEGGETMALNIWRRRKGKDTWHFCRNCSNWPFVDYDERTVKPTTGEFCNECLAKRDSGNCL